MVHGGRDLLTVPFSDGKWPSRRVGADLAARTNARLSAGARARYLVADIDVTMQRHSPVQIESTAEASEQRSITLQ